MRDLDLRMESDDEKKRLAGGVTPEVVNAPARASAQPTFADLTEAHEMLLRDLDEVRNAAQLVTERLAAIEAKLAPKEAALATQGQALERVAREALSEATREWAETAQRYRKFVDDMGSLAAWQEARAKTAVPSTMKPLMAAFLGGLLAGLIVIAGTSSAGQRVRSWIAGVPTIAPPPPAEEPAPVPANAKKPAKPGAR